MRLWRGRCGGGGGGGWGGGDVTRIVLTVLDLLAIEDTLFQYLNIIF